MRRLAAIMFTDMVGFTALMQEDEHRAKTIRDRHRDALRESIERHGGEIVQFYGDGTLSVFESAVEGVNAAVAAQRVLREGEHQQRHPESEFEISLAGMLAPIDRRAIERSVLPDEKVCLCP